MACVRSRVSVAKKVARKNDVIQMKRNEMPGSHRARKIKSSILLSLSSTFENLLDFNDRNNHECKDKSDCELKY